MLLSRKAWAFRIVSSAMVVLWLTVGDLASRLLGTPETIYGTETWGRLWGAYELGDVSAIAFCVVFWVVIQFYRRGARALIRWQTYLGSIIALLGGFPLYPALRAVGLSFTSIAPMPNDGNWFPDVPGKPILVAAILAAKVGIWRYWWKTVVLSHTRELSAPAGD